MTRERWEQILFAHVGDEVVQDMLNQYALELESDNAKLRELVAEMFNACPMCVRCAHNHLTVGWYGRMRELGVEP